MSLPTAPIDPFAAIATGGYVDDVVEVRRRSPAGDGPAQGGICTEHFDVRRHGDRVLVDHGLVRDRVDDDLAGLLAAELFGPGWLRGSDLFERIFTGIVLTCDDDPLDAWEAFYRNTLRRVQDEISGAGLVPHGAHGTIAGYAPVYGHASSLLAGGEVLELGCCFGFFSLRLALEGRTVTASDLNTGSVRLLEQVAPRLGARLTTHASDAARYPAPTGSYDTVLVLHLLEHLDPDHGDRVIAESLRLARRRVVVAVPLEEEADEVWGHVRTVSLMDLERWGAAAVALGAARAFDVHEFHGGWLTLDV